MSVNQRETGGSSNPDSPMPSRVGKYRIDGILGRGAIGLVYKGYDEQIDRPVAIKTLHPEILNDVGGREELLKRFSAEARSAARCLHPNIVTVFDFVEHEGAPYIVMEYVNAGTLETVLRCGVLPPIRQVGEVMAQLLFALGYAHSKGVIHRDVKPANILCPSAVSIKVSDFGVARIETMNLTQSPGFTPVGTPNYMAPERFLGRASDGRADLFSAGVVFFQLLTGAKPFPATDLPDLIRKLMHEAPLAPSSLRPELWPELDEVCARALARNPEDRFQDAHAFVDAMNLAIEARPSENSLPLDLTKLSIPAPRQPACSEQLNRTMADRLSASTIDKLGRSLANALGPIARLLVKQAAKDSMDPDTFISFLSKQIQLPAEAEAFRKVAEATLLEDIGVAAVQLQLQEIISAAEMRAVTEMLLPILGPVARVLVKKQAATAVGREDFYKRLSDALPSAEDKARFMTMRDKLLSTPS